MKIYDVLILGSGPAGNTCGIYCVRSGLSTAILTGINVGGQLTITTEIENFPGFPKAITGSELMNRTIEQAQNLGVEIIYDHVKEVNFDKLPYLCKTENGEEFACNNLVIATGAKAKWLGLKSESEFLGFGVSGCATCDGNFFRNKPVAVIGGGDTAGTEALHLANLCSEVYLIYRKENLGRMQKSLVNQIETNSKIKVIFNSELQEVVGNSNPKKVEKIQIINNKTQELSELNVNGVFIAIGRKPESDLFINTQLKLDENGYIITEKASTRTNIKHVYACGDVANKKYKQAIVAAGYGCISALEIQEDYHKC